MVPHSLVGFALAARGHRLGPRLARAQRLAAFFTLALFVLGNAVPGDAIARSVKSRVRKAKRESGVASYYGPGFYHRRTASGERFDPGQLTAAHRTLPFGTRVRVTNLDNGRRVVVRINDRGPYWKGRVLDLSPAAARRLGFASQGLARVRLDVLSRLPASYWTMAGAGAPSLAELPGSAGSSGRAAREAPAARDALAAR